MRKNLSLIAFIFILVILFSCEMTNLNLKEPTYEELQIKALAESGVIKKDTFAVLFIPIIEPVVNNYKRYFKIPKYKIEILLTAMVIHETSGKRNGMNRPLQSSLGVLNGLYGVKTIESRPSVNYSTIEFENGEFVPQKDDFSIYYSFRDATDLWFKFMIASSLKDKNGEPFLNSKGKVILRYQLVFDSKTLRDVCNALEACGYATDPDYGEKLYVLCLEVKEYLNL